MTLKSVALNALLPPKANPRHKFDPSLIAGLAQSIRTDGVLQNLVVVPEGRKLRVLFGKRRYLALRQLLKEKAIRPDYRVPVDIKRGLAASDALRMAAVENVQREPLHPMDEAEAFATLLQTGGTVAELAEESGLSAQTIKRRVALAGLCSEAKEAFYAGRLTLGVAEALPLGVETQQKAIVDNVKRGFPVDADEVRATFLQGKPTLQMAIFPREQYTGSVTADLFADEETSYFDDVEQFFELQAAAVETLAEEHREKAAWVDVLNLHAVPWWQYADAPKRRKGGVVINMHPSGRVEVREGLIRHDVKPEVVIETRKEAQPRERTAFSAPLLRYAANHKTAALQAALLGNPRKAKARAALLLLGAAWGSAASIQLRPHRCLSELRQKQPQTPAYRVIEATAGKLADLIGISGVGPGPADGVERLLTGEPGINLSEVVDRLSDEHVDLLLVLLPILCFGQEEERPDSDPNSLFNGAAVGLGLNLREWWTPDAVFFASLRREQLCAIVQDCGATPLLAGFKSWSKTELVEGLTRLFRAAADGAQGNQNNAIRSWLPGLMRYPASAELTSES